MPDSSKVIVRSPNYENSSFGLGYSNTGQTTNNTTVKFISKLASALETSIELKPFSLDRY